MATALNKHTREAIKHAIIKSTFDAREAELKKASIALAQRVYEATMPEGFLERTKKLPADWFYKHSHAVIVIGRSRIYQPFASARSSDSFELPGARIFPANMGARYDAPEMPLDPDKAHHQPLIEEVKALCSAGEALQQERRDLSAKLEGLLASVRTVEKFKEVAPELADYIPDEVKQATQRGGLPTVLVGELVTGLMAAGLKVPKGSA